jgi:PelA/Pel-15E family pectate lyase
MNTHARRLLLAVLLASLSAPAAFARGAGDYLDRPDEWYRGPEGARVAANILSYQSSHGSWPKNIDTAAAPYAGDPARLQGTFDNGATVDELRFLARAYQATREARYQAAFLKGFDHILAAQYPTGGWPQTYPPGSSYPRHITFNDNTMARLMELLRETATRSSYAFLDTARRKSAREAFDRGIACILQCQIRVDGKLTAWCAQHDEKDYTPRPARTYELVSLSGSESVNLVRLLMSLDDPSPEAIRSIQSAVAWLESVKLTGIKEVRQPDPNSPRGFNKVVVRDPAAPPIWARFYQIGANKPLFVDRDGVPKENLADIGYERRNGYAWYGNWPQSLLAEQYPAWKTKWASRIAGQGREER